jgi:hypothetical protein
VGRASTGPLNGSRRHGATAAHGSRQRRDAGPRWIPGRMLIRSDVMDEIEEPPILVPHQHCGNPDCCGIIMPVVRGDQADLTCNECGTVIRTVAAARLSRRCCTWPCRADAAVKSAHVWRTEYVSGLQRDRGVHLPALWPRCRCGRAHAVNPAGLTEFINFERHDPVSRDAFNSWMTTLMLQT